MRGTVRPNQLLKMRLAHQRCTVFGSAKGIAHGGYRFRKLCSQRVCAVLAWVLSGYDRCTCGSAGRIGAICPGKTRSAGGKPVQIWRLKLWVDETQRTPVLLVACDEQDVGALTGHIRSSCQIWQTAMRVTFGALEGAFGVPTWNPIRRSILVGP